MSSFKNRLHTLKSHIPVAGILLLLILAGSLLLFLNINNTQAISAMAAQVRFYGEYRIEDGPWQTITEGQHIPTTKGDVTLRGNLHMLAPDGEYVGIYRGETPIAFYTNHISLTIREGENDPVYMDPENPLFGDSACGKNWSAYVFTSDSEDTIEILVQNPHRFGNDTAIDQMLSSLTFWTGLYFEKDIMESGQDQRNLGLFLIIVAFILLGSALYSALLHIPNNHTIWLLGATILSAGVYMAYTAPGVPFWSESIAVNTSVLGFSMMFYTLFVSAIITGFLKATKKIGYLATTAMGAAIGIFFLLPIVTEFRFYDTWLPWVTAQSIVNAVLLVCLVQDSITADRKQRWTNAGMAMLMLAFEGDVIATAAGFWEGGLLSSHMFMILFTVSIFVVLRIIPESINAAAKAKELEAEKNTVEAELKESRISIMLSQIQPHFIYNTLGTIERMCLKDPEKAFDLVRNFSLYLRGNFSELDSVTPIRFEEELKHVEYYVNIEKVRFPDMNIIYNVETTDFVLPALSVQPLVENAIKHGLMRLETGGTVTIRSYETPTHVCVEVKDDGVGFDPSLPLDEKKHVGLRNIRGRLNAMVNGELTIESQPGAGTRAVIMIPKE